MPYFLAQADDPSSDNGVATMVVKAIDARKARAIAVLHLYENNRGSLAKKLSVVAIQRLGSGLLYSDVEHRDE